MRCLVVFLCAFVLGTGSAVAGDAERCGNPRDPEAAVLGCSAIIEAEGTGDVELARAFNNRGNAFAALTQNRSAIMDYSRAVALDVHYANAFFNRGSAYLDMKEYDSAISDFDRVIMLDRNYLQAFNNRGLARMALGDFPGAVADFDAAIGLDPGSAVFLNNRGVAWKHAHDDARAIDDFSAAIALRPDYIQALRNRGEVSLKIGRFDDAEADFARILEIDPENKLARLHVLALERR